MKTILVVDDNKLNLAAARRALESEYRVIPVMKGQQALTYLQTGECDIILLDINMPDMDGFEVMERIRTMEKFANTPVVFLTADSDAETETHCFKMGALDFITKPFVPDVMLSRIGRILEIEDLRRSLVDRLEQKAHEISDIRSKSHRDALTGLWDRLYTEEKVNELLNQGSRGALLMMDIDNFKPVNDNYGHIAGDRTLKMFSDILREFSTEEDIVCRIGGDEFVIFVKDETSKEKLNDRAAAIIAEFRSRIQKFEFKHKVTISVGIAQASEDGVDFNQLYSWADKALYYVKQNGKDAHHFFSDKIPDDNQRNGKAVDLQYLQNLMSRTDNGMGAYLLDFESFHHVYNFIRRFVERSNNDVQTLLFTVSEIDNAELDPAETEFALEVLEKAIYTSLRRSDVSTRYSSKQQIVLLMDTNSVNGDMVAERIIDNFHKLYTRGKAHIDYGIARMTSRDGF